MMNKPILLLGPEGSGKQHILKGILQGSYGSYLCINHLDFIKSSDDIKQALADNVKYIVVEGLKDATALKNIAHMLYGMLLMSDAKSALIFTMETTDTTNPYPDFYTIICSHDIYSSKYNTH